jgi:Rieske Fe-S protein
MAESNQLDRRGFVSIILAFIGTVMGTTIGLPAIGYLISPAMKVRKGESWVSLGPLEKYPIGTPTLFNFTRTTINGWEKTVNSYEVYVMRQNTDQVISGPPPKPLVEYQTRIEAGNLAILVMEG